MQRTKIASTTGLSGKAEGQGCLRHGRLVVAGRNEHGLRHARRPHGRRLGRRRVPPPRRRRAVGHQSRPWPRKWDGDLSGRVTAGRVSLSGMHPGRRQGDGDEPGAQRQRLVGRLRLRGRRARRQQVVRHEPDRSDERLRLRLDGASASDPARAREPGLSKEGQDYVYATADWSWLVEVSTASDMPADLMAGGSAAAVFTPLAGDELSAAESAVAAKWDGDLSGRVTAGRVSLSEGSIPADAKVTVTSLGRSANDSWAGYDFAGGELAANGSFGMNQTAQMNGYGFELDGASASDPLVLVKTTGLSEKKAKDYVYATADWSWLVECEHGLRHARRPHGRRLGRRRVHAPRRRRAVGRRVGRGREVGRRPVGPRDGGPRVSLSEDAIRPTPR